MGSSYFIQCVFHLPYLWCFCHAWQERVKRGDSLDRGSFLTWSVDSDKSAPYKGNSEQPLGEGAVNVLMFVRWEGLSHSQRLSSQKPRRREKKTQQTPVWFITSQLLELATSRNQYPSTGGLSPVVPVVPAQSFALWLSGVVLRWLMKTWMWTGAMTVVEDIPCVRG